jgi:NADH dehydrogenase
VFEKPLLITGANGNLGRRLIGAALPLGPVRALVRSDAAAERLRGEFSGPEAAAALEVRRVDYLNSGQMADAAAGCRAAVHLVGIIKETSRSRYVTAHEHTTAVVCDALHATGCERLVYLSIVGAHPDSRNACLASKGRAEALIRKRLREGIVFQVPMVLGEGDYASAALRRRAAAGYAILLRGASLEQPIYAGDVVTAVLAALDSAQFGPGVFSLAGPESLSRIELTRRAAHVLGTRVRTLSVPLWLGLVLARLLEFLPDPPVTRAMLGVLDHDDAVDSSALARELNLTLTPVETMLTRVLHSTQG